jgi:ribosome biogenesis protein YTM1
MSIIDIFSLSLLGAHPLSFLPFYSHKSWVSAIQWSPIDPFVLATTSHDGTLKVWDIRSSLPLHTVKATMNKGDKSLCLAFGDGIIYSGGSDCVVKKFTL